MTPSKNVIIKEVKDFILSIPKDIIPGGLSDSGWTAKIKKGFLELGKKFDYETCPDECNRQWLYDLIWFKNNEYNHLVELSLVLESEWSKNIYEIKYDFEKLLVAKAPIKVMICQENGNVEDLIKMFNLGIDYYSKKDCCETYLIAIFIESEWMFKIIEK